MQGNSERPHLPGFKSPVCPGVREFPACYDFIYCPAFNVGPRVVLNLPGPSGQVLTKLMSSLFDGSKIFCILLRHLDFYFYKLVASGALAMGLKAHCLKVIYLPREPDCKIVLVSLLSEVGP